MKKLFYGLIAFSIFLIPSLSHADYFTGPVYGQVVQTPTYQCYYGILYDNNGNYDIFYDTAIMDVSLDTILYGGIKYGYQSFYNANTKRGTSLTIDEVSLIKSYAITRYYQYCPSY